MVRWSVAVVVGAVVSVGVPLLARPARAGESSPVGAVEELVVLGPNELFEGERAFFRAPTHADLALDLRATRTDDPGGESFVVPVDGLWPVGRTGRFRITPVNTGYVGRPREVVVHPLPPEVSPAEPIAKRRACVLVFVWDGGRSAVGEVLEQLGGAVGPERTRDAYAVTWTLSGPQATRESVNRAIAELAGRGYVIDIYSAVHGYPIGLADGDWTDFASNPGLRSVRLHYTTSCFGAEGAKDFLAAGVQTYVAARETNYLSSFHAARFLASFAQGETVQDASERAYRDLERIVRSPLLGKLLRDALRSYGGCDGCVEDLDAVLEGTRPQVFGAADVTIDAEPAPSPREGE